MPSYLPCHKTHNNLTNTNQQRLIDGNNAKCPLYMFNDFFGKLLYIYIYLYIKILLSSSLLFCKQKLLYHVIIVLLSSFEHVTLILQVMLLSDSVHFYFSWCYHQSWEINFLKSFYRPNILIYIESHLH